MKKNFILNIILMFAGFIIVTSCSDKVEYKSRLSLIDREFYKGIKSYVEMFDSLETVNLETSDSSLVSYVWDLDVFKTGTIL